MPASQVFEGTWEEVARQADRLADKRVRLVIVENGQDEAAEAQLPFYATATPEERAQTWVEWCHLPRPQVAPLSDAAITRERTYSPEGD